MSTQTDVIIVGEPPRLEKPLEHHALSSFAKQGTGCWGYNLKITKKKSENI